MSYLDKRQLDEDRVRDRLIRLPEEPLLEQELALHHLATLRFLLGGLELGHQVTDVLVLVQADMLV